MKLFLFGYEKLPPNAKALAIKLLKKNSYIKYTLLSLEDWTKCLDELTVWNTPKKVKDELFALLFAGEE